MALNFPISPSNGDIFNAPNGIRYEYDGVTGNWSVAASDPSALPDESVTPEKLSEGGPVWTSEGYLGVNTAIPQTALHVTSTGVPTFRLVDADNSSYFDISADNGNIILRADRGNSAVDSYISGQIDNFEKFRVTVDGDFGIGTQTPDAKLEIVTDEEEVIRLRTSTNNNYIGFHGGDDTNWKIGNESTNYVIKYGTDNRLTLDSLGNLNVSGAFTADGGISAADGLDISSSDLAIDIASSTGNAYIEYGNTTNANVRAGSYGDTFSIYNDTTQRFSVNLSNGDVTFSGEAILSNSTPTNTLHATSKGYVDAEIAVLEASLTPQGIGAATAAQGALADTAVQPNDNVTLGTITSGTITTNSGNVNLGNGASNSRLLIKKADNDVSDHIIFYNGTTRVGEIGVEDTSFLRLNQETATNIFTPRYIRADGGFFVGGTSKGINGSGNFIGGTIAGASDYSTLIRSDADDIVTGHTEWQDNHNVRLGNSADFRMYHNGSDNYFESYNGHIYIRANCSSDLGDNIYIQARNGEHSIVCNDDSSVALYNNGSISLDTLSSGGVRIYGNLTPDENSTGSIGTSGTRWSAAYINTVYSDNIYPREANADQLGASSRYWNAAYVTNINTSTVNVSSSVSLSNNVELNFGSSQIGEMFSNGTDVFLDLNSSADFQIRAGTTPEFIFNRNGTLTCGALNTGAGTFTSVYSSGNVTAYSDERLKEDIEVIPNAVDKVKEIRGVTYTRNDLEGDGRHAGVIAQEVEKVLPEVVIEVEDGIKSVNYGAMVGLLIEAIKEQQKEIDELKAKING